MSVKKNKKPAPAMYAPREVKQEFPKFARPGSVAKTKIQPTVNTQYIREDGLTFKTIPSLSTTGGSTAKKAESKYTGDHLIGISIVHKSCLTPCFTQEYTTELANMRR